MLYCPDRAPVAALLVCDPLFEERKSAQRVLVEAARALAAAGVAVLRFDYRGCGDSSGDFAEFAPSDWQADIQAAWAFLQQTWPGVPAGVLGLRFGGTLAATAGAALPGLAGLILWEPVLRGGEYLQQELRKKLMKEMVTFGGNRETREGLLARLAGGEAIDFDGYAVAPRLYRELQDLDLARLPTASHGPTLLVGITSSEQPTAALTRLAEQWTKGGARVTLKGVREQPFWNLIGHVECLGLIQETAAWIEAWSPRAQPSSAAPSAESARVPLAAIIPIAPGERLVSFAGAAGIVRGVLHAADSATDHGRPAVLFLHGWSGGRLGPHRMFVKLARRLAAAGFTCLRPDFCGRGDSDGRTADATIQSMIADARAAVDYLAAQRPGRPIILLAICSGGKVAIGTAVERPAVTGLVLWSGEALGSLRSAATNTRKSAFALRSYLRKLTNPETWRKIIRLQVNLKLVRKALLKHETRGDSEAQQEERILARFRAWRGQVLFIYGSNDPDTRLAAGNYETFCTAQGISHMFHEIAGANHSFYSLAWEQEVMDLTGRWLAALPPATDGRTQPR